MSDSFNRVMLSLLIIYLIKIVFDHTKSWFNLILNLISSGSRLLLGFGCYILIISLYRFYFGRPSVLLEAQLTRVILVLFVLKREYSNF